MSAAPRPGEWVGRDLLFVSYSHEDADWAQRFGVLLKPLVQRKNLRLWDDTAIRVGAKWHPAIEQAIGCSRVALLLVSADFLASDYVMDRELPTLLAHGVLLAPVLVGDCFWSVMPELEAVQWLHDPGRDGALNLITDRPGERDRRIWQASQKLVELLPLTRRPLVVAYSRHQATPATGPVALLAVRRSDRRYFAPRLIPRLSTEFPVQPSS